MLLFKVSHLVFRFDGPHTLRLYTVCVGLIVPRLTRCIRLIQLGFDKSTGTRSKCMDSGSVPRDPKHCVFTMVLHISSRANHTLLMHRRNIVQHDKQKFHCALGPQPTGACLLARNAFVLLDYLQCFILPFVTVFLIHVTDSPAMRHLGHPRE